MLQIEQGCANREAAHPILQAELGFRGKLASKRIGSGLYCLSERLGHFEIAGIPRFLEIAVGADSGHEISLKACRWTLPSQGGQASWLQQP